MEANHNKCVGWCDIDKYARKSYLAMYPHARSEWNAKDIRTVTNAEWKKLDRRYGKINVICGGFPCQSFSIAGKRKGFLDKTRGTLFFQIARAAKEIKPQYLFLENVKGLLNHRHGKTFATILATLDEIGYNAEWQVLNSKNFGVPQNRERVYIIGHLRGSRTQEVFHWKRQAKENPKGLKVERPFKNKTKNGWEFEQNVLDPKSISSTLRAGGGSGNIPKIRYYHKGKHQAHSVYKTNGISPTTSATDYKHPIHIQYYHKSNKILNRINKINGVSPTLSTMQGGNREPKIAYYHKDYTPIPKRKGKGLKVKEATTKNGYVKAMPGDSINLAYPTNPNKRGRVGWKQAHTVDTNHSQGVVLNRKPKIFYYHKGKHQTDNIYKTNGVSPTITFTDDHPKNIAYYHKDRKHMNNRIIKSDGESPSITSTGHKPKVAIPVLTPDRIKKRQNGRRFKNNQDPMFTLTAEDRDGVALNIKEATKKGYDKAYPGDSINMSYPDSKTRRGRVGHKKVNTLTASNTNGTQEGVVLNNLVVRKLTPKECWRLQGFKDKYFDKAKKVCSNSQLYKQAGNAVSVPVIKWIAKRLYVY